MSYKNTGAPFETEDGSVTRQKGPQGRIRLRFDLPGMDHVYVPADRLIEFADLVDDVTDAIADGLWERGGPPYEKRGLTLVTD